MEWKKNKCPFCDELEPIISGMGFSLVELSRQPMKGSLQVRAVIYHYRGVGLKDCEMVHRTIMPRLELIEQSQDIYLEVTSPGITRTLKYADEFSVFLDRKVNIMKEEESEWIHGSISGTDQNSLELNTEDGMKIIPIEEIKKAKLAYSQEDNK